MAIGTQQPGMPRDIVSPMPRQPAPALLPQRAPQLRQKLSVTIIAAVIHFPRPKGDQPWQVPRAAVGSWRSRGCRVDDLASAVAGRERRSGFVCRAGEFIRISGSRFAEHRMVVRGGD